MNEAVFEHSDPHLEKLFLVQIVLLVLGSPICVDQRKVILFSAGSRRTPSYAVAMRAGEAVILVVEFRPKPSVPNLLVQPVAEIHPRIDALPIRKCHSAANGSYNSLLVKSVLIRYD